MANAITTLSLFPVEVGEELERRFPGRLAALDQEARLTLATPLLEERVSNNRLQELTERHPNDLTEMLRRLVHQCNFARLSLPQGRQQWRPCWHQNPQHFQWLARHVR